MAGFPEMAAGKLLVMKARGPELGVAKVNKTQTTPTMRIWGLGEEEVHRTTSLAKMASYKFT